MVPPLSDSPSSASPGIVPLKALPTWRIPAWLNVALMAGPFLGLYEAFGRISGAEAVWAWGVLGAAAVAATLLVRGRPLTRVHPLAWSRRPWLLAGMTGFLWLIILAAAHGAGSAYGAAGLVVALVHVLFTTPGGENAPRYGGGSA